MAKVLGNAVIVLVVCRFGTVFAFGVGVLKDLKLKRMNKTNLALISRLFMRGELCCAAIGILFGL